MQGISQVSEASVRRDDMLQSLYRLLCLKINGGSNITNYSPPVIYGGLLV